MALVTLTNNMPHGLRLQAFFTSVIAGSLSFGNDADASFRVTIYESPVDVFYGGPVITSAQGEASFLRFGPIDSPWLIYGYANGPALFTYSDLSHFHQQGQLAAAIVMAGDDRLIGSSFGDYLEGFGGNDTLDGGAGGDTLVGGSGNDTYFVDDKDDRIFEAIGGGHDVVWTTASYAMAPDSEIEELRAAGAAFSISLTGNIFPNLIVGTSGNDTLAGNGGGDTLIGGAGDDLLIVDDPSDKVLENAGQGYDTIVASTTYSLGDNIEVLKAAAGTSPIGLTGNNLANEIIGNQGHNTISGLGGDDRLYGDGGNDAISGGAGKDELYGGIGNDLLNGGSGNDRLYGDVGNDTLEGSLGHDRLYGGTGKNKLLGGDGNDTLYGGMHADTLHGGNGNDRLYGDVGNDRLEGGAGRDTLSGGWGRDIFIFRNALKKTNIDTITDFNVRDDTIHLENSIFKKLGKAGKLNPDFFIVGTQAQDSNDYLIYNKSTGSLHYDADGSGGRNSILFAKLKSGLSLTYQDFLVL